MLCKIFAAETTKGEIELQLGKKFIRQLVEIFERQKLKGSVATDYIAVGEKDEIHRVLMEAEPLVRPQDIETGAR